VESQESYKLVGMVTDRDLCMAVVADGKEARMTPLAECMSRSLICCFPDADLEDALALMQNNHVHRLLVIDKEMRIEGIVSTADLVRNADSLPRPVESILSQISEPPECL
jgi:CBS domain-containing protein